jgi:hypothetical protein
LNYTPSPLLRLLGIPTGREEGRGREEGGKGEGGKKEGRRKEEVEVCP